MGDTKVEHGGCRFVATSTSDGKPAIAMDLFLGLDLQCSRKCQVFEEHPSLDFRLHDVAIHFIAEVGVGMEINVGMSSNQAAFAIS